MKQLQEKLLKGKDDKTQWKDQNEKMLGMRDQVFEANSVIKQNKITMDSQKNELRLLTLSNEELKETAKHQQKLLIEKDVEIKKLQDSISHLNQEARSNEQQLTEIMTLFENYKKETDKELLKKDETYTS